MLSASKAKLSSPVTVTLVLENAVNLAGAPVRVKWDPKVLRLSDASKGTLFDTGSEPPIYTRNIRNDEGEVTVNLSQKAGGSGVKGTGSLVKLTFQAVGKGSTSVSVAEANLRDVQMQPIKVETPAVTVNVE